MLTISGWLEAQDLLLLNVANRLLNEFYPGAIPVKAAELVDTRCPGLSSAIRSFHSALWDSVGENPRAPQESDLVDAVHAMYAPYVSIFRADRYMSPHVERQVGRHGTQVVSRLESLPDQIHGMLAVSST